MGVHVLKLVFPHQLFRETGGGCDQVCVLEDSLFFGDRRYPARFHRQKLVLHRASMKAWAAARLAEGVPVTYVEYDPERSLTDLIRGFQPDRVQVVDPVDDVLEKRLRRACTALGAELELLPSPIFLTAPDWAEGVLKDRPPYRMATFYAAQRARLDVLMEAGRPVGGVWSLDAENRRKWPKNRMPPPEPCAPSNAFVEEALTYVERRFPGHPGLLRPFRYPVTPADADTWLRDFLAQRLDGFGSYEDAIVAAQPVLHHSVLTPMLNIGLLTPRQVLDAALAHADRAGTPLNDLEGFVRQVIGWREFMMVMYRKLGTAQRQRNFWHHERPMPDAFYTGSTGIDPVDTVIRRVLATGYSHHIERLMVVGNFMLLCEIQPDAVYRWFMELYIDAYDWVMVPNVYGMSQFADGGWLCTKPYISGSNYIRKMSDFRPGPWCEIWDGLFWRFIHKHRAFFERQPRLSMMARQLDRMPPQKRQAHLQTADHYLAKL